MECKNCHSKWEPGRNVAKPPAVCPFCGADLAAADGSRPDRYDNSKDALAFIMREHGADVLLGSRLKNFFRDYAPDVRKSRKNVVFFVIESGAAEILKRNIAAGAGEQEIAFRQAVQKVINECPIERSEVESVMLEFTAALGWKITIQPQEPPVQSLEEKQTQPSSALNKQQTAPATQKRQKRQKQQTPSDVPVQTAGSHLTFRQRKLRFGRQALEKEQTQSSPAAQKQWTAPVPQTQQSAPAAQKQKTAPTPQKQPKQPKPAPQKQQAGRLMAGQRNVPFGGYSWRVLDVQNGKALLLAEEILEKRPYHSPGGSVTWETCGLRGYLNGEFLQTFNGPEQSRIVQTVNANKDNPWYGTQGGNRTADRVFLLSIEEVVKYFGDSDKLWRQSENEYCIDDRYNDERKANYGSKAWWWWLRSPGSSGYDAADVDLDGSLSLYGRSVRGFEGGVRPALWLNL